jgi:ketosteroid isomerase-like protein
VYHAIVRRRIRGVFENLNRGDWRAPLADTAEDVHHVFPGDHALGGERHSRAALERWFERLFRLFPEPRFEVRRVAARGWPWSTWVSAEWIDQVTPAGGAEPYVNHGSHWVHVRWGKVTEIHAYLDSQRVAQACEELAERGVEEAAAPPIAD